MSDNSSTEEMDIGTDIPVSAGVAAPAASQPNTRNKRRLYTRKIAVTGVFTALSYGLYLLGKFCKLPFIFPSFFDLQFSELPALIAGFVLGPVYGAAVIVLKCLLKMPLSGTAMVGEATDILLGLALVLPASILYRRKRDLRGAVWGVVLGSVCLTALAVLVNRYISVPFYVRYYFGGNEAVLVGMLKPLFPALTWDNFYTYYLCLSVIPFNLLRCILICVLTFALYKRLSRLIKRWLGEYSAPAAPRAPRKKVSFGRLIACEYVPTMWSVLILLAALVVAVLVGCRMAM